MDIEKERRAISIATSTHHGRTKGKVETTAKMYHPERYESEWNRE